MWNLVFPSNIPFVEITDALLMSIVIAHISTIIPIFNVILFDRPAGFLASVETTIIGGRIVRVY